MKPVRPSVDFVPNSANPLVVIGMFPPPLHGASWVTDAIYTNLHDIGVRVLQIDLSPGGSPEAWRRRFRRLSKVVNGLIAYGGHAIKAPRGTVYLGLSGGLGQFYELLFILIARISRARLFLHHHSFAYIDQRQIVTSVLFACAGRGATHVTLCSHMKTALKKRYGYLERVSVVSNATILSALSMPPRARREARVIGFLGNIASEKGILEFLQVLERMATQSISIRGLVAGPFSAKSFEREIMSRLSLVPDAEYVGPVYGPSKEAFLERIDVLLFPTKYVNEAEPVTILEALQHGVPVIAWDRGCIRELVSSQEGLLVERTSDFVSAAMTRLLEWNRCPQIFQSCSAAAAEKFRYLQSQYSTHLGELLKSLPGGSSSLSAENLQ
jgi:glycosyltransferase involved in cell wall biosynthesis